LLFGSFNPVHVGHLIIASYFVEYTDLDQVWFVVSPLNPLKDNKDLLAERHRLAMVNLAVGDDPRFKATDIEFKMPKPSYTIDTLAYLQEKFPDTQFVLLAGSDILSTLDRWKNYDMILQCYKIYVYYRPGYHSGQYEDHPSIRMFKAPLMQISSSFIRKSVREGRDMRYMMPGKAYEFMREMHFYE
jgi:nicotinate-nucleotide adenylyltransferase